MNTTGLPRLALIAGPTASGKSALALALAEAHRGTVINADASQVYRDLRVVTARPDPAEAARVPHLLYGHVDAADTGYSAARWAAEARAAIWQTHAAGRLPVLVGGTGLYLRTLLDGIAPVPPIDPAVRAAVRALPVATAHAALALEDPAAAQRLAPADAARVARALEVIRATGRPLAAWQRRRTGGIAAAVDLRALVLLPDRAWLAERIGRRSRAIVADGRAEVAALLSRPDLPADAPVRRAIGVPELGRLLAGEVDPAEAELLLHRSTARYAKRQYTWFRHQPPAEWRKQENVTGQVEEDIKYLAS